MVMASSLEKKQQKFRSYGIKSIIILKLIHPKHKSKHKLEKWFIIFADGVRLSVHTYVRTYVRTYKTNHNTKQTDQRVTFQASALVGA